MIRSMNFREIEKKIATARREAYAQALEDAADFVATCGDMPGKRRWIHRAETVAAIRAIPNKHRGENT